MRSRCSTRRRRAAGTHGPSVINADDHPSPPESAGPPGRFVQVLVGELARFASTHGLGFDERCLLEHLLLVADHRSGAIAPFSLTDLARDLGLGPSGRRTVRGRLERLKNAGAVTWVSPNASRPGCLQVLVYSQLVHGGAADRRRGFVQLVPSALAELCRRHSLSPTASALILRLALQVDPRSHVVASSTAAALSAELAVGWGRLGPAFEELAAAGVIDWSPRRPLRVVAYDRVVRTASASRPNPATTARSEDGRAANPPKRAPVPAEARGPQDVLSRVQDPDLNPKTTPPVPPEPPAVDGPDGGGWGLVAEIESLLTGPQRQVLHEPCDRGPLTQLASELDRLLDGGWKPEELLAHVGAELPGSWRSPARILWARADKLPTAPPSPETLRATADAVRDRAEIQGARSYAANQAAVEFLEIDEIVARLAQCYSGEALAAALAVVAECRPGEDLARAVRCLGEPSALENSSPNVDDAYGRLGLQEERRRRRGASSTAPIALGELLAEGAE